ncbi:TPA: hypothetical protein P2L25_004662 [Aeromonas salmonicida]|nr:hypothetical protein [Aeromonas salmonicida]HDN9509864.1 hypothetical protein [Aeromonas salmonicida]
MMNPFSWLQMTNMISYQGLVRTFPKHFVKDRMNDSRNNPLIMIAELNSIFNRLTALHLESLKKLKHHDSFNVRCTVSHINMPCAVNKVQVDGGEHQENIVITVMRKKDWKSKDPKEFLV